MQDGEISEEQIGIRTARKGTIYIMGRLLSAASTLAILIFLTRYLGAAEYGLYAIAAAFTSVLGMSGNFGLGTGTRKRLPELESRKDVSRHVATTYFIALLASGLIMLLGIGISGYIAVNVYKNASLYIPLIIASITVVLSVIYNVSNSVLVGLDKVKQASICNIIYAFAQLVGVVLLVLLGFSIEGALAGLAIGLAVGTLVALFYIVRSKKVDVSRPSLKLGRKMLGFSLPIMVSNVAYVGIANLAIDLLGIVVAPNIVGSFGAAYKLGKTFDLILVSSTFVLLPALSKAFSDPSLSKKISEIYNTSIFYLIMLVLPVLVFLITSAKYITRILFSGAYPYSGIYFALISVGITIQVISSFAGTLIISHGNTKRFMKYQLIGVMAEFILLVLLIQRFDAYGVILSIFIIGPLLINYMYIRMLRNEFKIRLDYGKIGKLFTLALATWLIVTILNYYATGISYFTVLLDFVAVVLIYPPLLILTGSANSKNMDFVGRMTKGLPILGSFMAGIVRYATLFSSEEREGKAKQ